MNEFNPKNKDGEKCGECGWYQASQEALKECLVGRKEYAEQLQNGRDYLMTVDADEISVEDALEAFGFGRDGLK